MRSNSASRSRMACLASSPLFSSIRFSSISRLSSIEVEVFLSAAAAVSRAMLAWASARRCWASLYDRSNARCDDSAAVRRDVRVSNWTCRSEASACWKKVSEESVGHGQELNFTFSARYFPNRSSTSDAPLVKFRISCLALCRACVARFSLN